MPDKIPSAERDRPFPWRCSECGAKAVYPKATDYTSKVKHDGRAYEVRIPDLEIPTCRQCGEQYFTVGTDNRITTALRALVGLLEPQKIHEHRARLKMSQEELADQLGVAKETISRWETGAMIQSRAMDNLLRLYFESEEVRRLLHSKFEPDAAKLVNRIQSRYSSPEEQRAHLAAARGFQLCLRN
jgi:putative zinc finger/helix-turn-helix YgiT family protein